MSKPSIYLAGPISGLTYGECTDWRGWVTARLDGAIKCWSPMRAKDYLSGKGALPANLSHIPDLHCLSQHRGIMTRDRFDATRCDLLLANLIGAERISIGTCMEIAWADLARIPIVCVMEDKGNLHDHGMILEAIGFRVNNLDDALDVVRAVLL